MTINIFAVATRRKLRFPISGSITVEDVWDLPLKSKRDHGADLDKLAQILDAEVEKLPRRSFVDEEVQTSENSEVLLKLEIVKAIIATKKEEASSKQTEIVNAAKRRDLDALIARKKDAALESLSVEELEKIRDNLSQ